MSSPPARRRLLLTAATLTTALVAAGPTVALGQTAGASVTRPADELAADAAGDIVLPWRELEHRPAPEDRYALTQGCYVVRSAASGGYVVRSGDGFAATGTGAGEAEPFHFQATELGRYLLYGSQQDYLAAAGDPFQGAPEAAAGTVQDNLRGTYDESLDPVRDPLLEGSEALAAGVDATLDPIRDGARGEAVVSAEAPSPYADWELAADADDPDRLDPAGYRLTLPDTGQVLTAAGDGTLAAAAGAEGDADRFTFELAAGRCAAWPEVEVNVTGDVPTGDTAYEHVRGYLDAHLHMMAFEFIGGRSRCGQPWHRYGVTHALVDCPDHEPGGAGAALELALGGPPTHDTTGWPDFPYWPRYDSLTHEQVHYKWLERAWRGGLRMFTNLLVDNGVLCEAYPYKRNSCNEMDGVRLQAQRLRELENYIDAQSGGPGEGWFRIVDDPFEARRVMNAGKLAVVMGIEVSVLFDCGEYLGVPRCDTGDIDERLAEVHDLGVRQMELVNKFDNALSGVTGDGGTTGLVVNNGNRHETGHWWRMQTCDEPPGHAEGEDAVHAHDKTQPNPNDDLLAPTGAATFTERDGIFGAVLQLFGGTGAAPVYPEGPHCNTAGLTALGEYLVRQMIQRGMLFDPDHMSSRARQEALSVIEAEGYAGVVSSHSWADDTIYERVLGLGGVVTPYAGDAQGFVAKWDQHLDWVDDRFYFGFGYGADTNGFGSQGAPRNPAEGEGVTYPFAGLGGVVIDRQVSGNQVYDINTDGVDHYGLYPDWIEDLRVLAGDAIVEDLARGPEAYLQTWERAVGIAPDACRPDVALLTEADVQRVRPAFTPEDVLLTLGQPHDRQDDTFIYCVQTPSGPGTTTISFDARGRIDTVLTSGGSAPRATPAGPAAGGGAQPAAAAQGQVVTAGAHDHASHTHGGARWPLVALIAGLVIGGAQALRRGVAVSRG